MDWNSVDLSMRVKYGYAVCFQVYKCLWFIHQLSRIITLIWKPESRIYFHVNVTTPKQLYHQLL